MRGELLDGRSDVFALGVLLYEMATGRRPFEGASAAQLVAAVLRDTPRPPSLLNPCVAPGLEGLIAACLEKDRARRPAAADVARVLRRLLAEPGAARARRSIAVLPFDDLSREKDQDYFCEGVAEEILIALRKVQDLRVASRVSAFRCKAADLELAEIGARLGVDTVLDGSVRRADDRLRVTVELVSAADGFQLWSERYDRELKDVFAVQDEIARSVVDALQVRLAPGEREAMARLRAVDLEAYEPYLRARRCYYEFTRRSVERARRLFTEAREREPRLARAWAGSSDCGSFLYLYAGRDPAQLERAVAEASQALELDPDLAEAHASLGVALSLSERHAEAEQAFETAIRLDPELYEAHYFYARDSFVQGQLERAARQYLEASRVRPEDYQAPLLVAQIQADLGRPQEAAASRRRGVRLVEEHVQLRPEDARAWYMGANGLVALGERERGLAWADRALALDPDDPMLLYNVACVKSLAGSLEEAIACLERAVDAGVAQRGWLEHDSNLDPIRQNPRFQALLRRLA
jgi:TolB-like protein/Flp pilus assembly protein TadD